ncbi:hypothetical protein KAR34_09405 [bacterium]|nr:hypothetical protein [bacterium]
MKSLPYLLIFWCLLVISNFSAAQASLDISGEIETRLSFELSESEAIWSRTTFEPELDSQISDNTHAHVSLKMHTAGELNFDWNLQEAYIDYYLGSLDLRAGVQIISWGTAYGINPTDNINPFDLSEEQVFIPEEKLGVTALRLKYYLPANLSLTGVYLPYFVPMLEMPGAVLPEKTIKNAEYACKLTAQSMMGCDLSTSYFKGREDYPWITGEYREVEIYGVDIIGTLSEIALWAEGAYNLPESGDAYYQIAVGGEYTFGDDLYCLAQYYHRNYEDMQEHYIMTVLRHPFLDIHTLQLGMAYEITNEIFILYPEMTCSIVDAANIVLSGIFVQGEAAGTFMSGLKDKIYLKVEYGF